VSTLPKRREALKRKIAVLTFDEVNGQLSPTGRQLLNALRLELKTVNRMLSAPKRPKAKGKGPSVVQGPAGGVRRVVSGGAPGSGKRS
jgi:hypothetical protein